MQQSHMNGRPLHLRSSGGPAPSEPARFAALLVLLGDPSPQDVGAGADADQRARRRRRAGGRRPPRPCGSAPSHVSRGLAVTTSVVARSITERAPSESASRSPLSTRPATGRPRRRSGTRRGRCARNTSSTSFRDAQLGRVMPSARHHLFHRPCPQRVGVEAGRDGHASTGELLGHDAVREQRAGDELGQHARRSISGRMTL